MIRRLLRSTSGSYPILLFFLGIGLFVFSRFYHLADFPIYFFCDEAFVGAETRYLLDNGFRDGQGRLLPMYYEKAPGRWVPQISLYLSLPVVWLWPVTVAALRSVTVVFCLFGAIATCLSIKWVEPHNRWWWLPMYFFCVTPVWFLHSRLAFETTLAVAFSSVFIGSYLLYRWRNPRYAWISLVAAISAFYSHLSGTTLIVFSLPLLALIDFRYHLKNWRSLVPILLCGLLSLFPCIYWLVTMPNALGQQLSVMHSPLVSGTPWTAALLVSFHKWLAGLDPFYWFSEGPQNQLRHIWKGRSMIPYWSAPLVALGIISCLLSPRKPGSVLFVTCLLISVTPLLWVDSHIMRGFYILAPLAYLVARGASTLHSWRRGKFLAGALPMTVVALSLGYQTLAMTREAIIDAPTWYNNYGLYGLQWGSQQLFGQAIPAYLKTHPNVTIQPSTDWANGVSTFPGYFLTQEYQQKLRFLPFEKIKPKPGFIIPDNHVFILSNSERKKVESSGKYKAIEPQLEILWPNGEVGFTFSALEFVDTSDEFSRQLQ